MRMRLVHVVDELVRVRYGDVTVLEYHYQPDVPTEESPKPYVHPLATPRGDVLSLYRPHDHPWHHGLYFGWASVNDVNLWGGASYVRDKGYVNRHDHGAMVHEGWDVLEVGEQGVLMKERIVWQDVESRPMAYERRTLVVHHPQGEDSLLVTIGTEITPAPECEPLRFSSPMIEGRPDSSGYSGLTLRLPRSMTGGEVVNSAGSAGDAVMGERAQWVYYTGGLDGSCRVCGVAIFDHPRNPRYPTHFFVRTMPYGVLNPALCWDEVYVLSAGETLRLTYGVWVYSGEADPTQVRDVYERWLRDTTG